MSFEAHFHGGPNDGRTMTVPAERDGMPPQLIRVSHEVPASLAEDTLEPVSNTGTYELTGVWIADAAHYKWTG